MNGTFTAEGRLAPDRWVDVGAAEAENELRLGGWRVQVRAARLFPCAPSAAAPGSSTTVVEPWPFGASQSPTVAGESGGEKVLASFAGVVDHLSEPVYALRVARTALGQAVAGVLAAVAESERAALGKTLAAHFPELRIADESTTPWVPIAPVRSSSPADVAALAIVRELSFQYTGRGSEMATPDEVAAFKRRLRSGIDALVHGLVQALAGVNAYVDEMHISPDASAGQLPRTDAELGKAVFGEGADGSDGGDIVRRAFHEIAIHQVASFNAILSGVRELLGELAPETIEAMVSREFEGAGFWRRLWGRFLSGRRLLAAYRRRHRDLSTEESARFALIFGRRFADEYHATVRETRSSSIAQGAPPALPAPQSNTSAPPSVHARGGTVPLASPIVPLAENPKGAALLRPRKSERDRSLDPSQSRLGGWKGVRGLPVLVA